MKQKGYKDLGFDFTYAKAHKEGKKVEVEFFLFSLLIRLCKVGYSVSCQEKKLSGAYTRAC